MKTSLILYLYSYATYCSVFKPLIFRLILASYQQNQNKFSFPFPRDTIVKNL